MLSSHVSFCLEDEYRIAKHRFYLLQIVENLMLTATCNLVGISSRTCNEARGKLFHPLSTSSLSLSLSLPSLCLSLLLPLVKRVLSLSIISIISPFQIGKPSEKLSLSLFVSFSLYIISQLSRFQLRKPSEKLSLSLPAFSV